MRGCKVKFSFKFKINNKCYMLTNKKVNISSYY